ncbi:MAG: flagellar basal-body rod protein FlgF [Xanthobacteraceae bacterium]|nr:flagellar basal-body rod protein FlgF [Xanthobacteraceae bacterium]
MGETTIIHLSRLIALERRLDNVANNVANADTTGFRARQLSFQEYLSPAKEGEVDGKRERPVSLVNAGFQYPDSSGGAIQLTGNPLDVAIVGDGYFAVQTPQGERYTRAGALTVDATGRLVTMEGQPILSRNGPITISPEERSLTIAADGTISSRQRILGSLRLVRFDGPLQAVGSNLFQSQTPALDIPTGAVRLSVGALEKSNVQNVQEMSRLSEVTRSYEQVGGLLKNSQSVDDLNKLGTVPD